MISRLPFPFPLPHLSLSPLLLAPPSSSFPLLLSPPPSPSPSLSLLQHWVFLLHSEDERESWVSCIKKLQPKGEYTIQVSTGEKLLQSNVDSCMHGLCVTTSKGDVMVVILYFGGDLELIFYGLSQSL